MTLETVLASMPHLLVAFVLGVLIGAERQWRHRTAGLKTNALVAIGAASFVVWAPVTGTPDAAARIAAQIVSGIGFLGAGVILREGLNVRGLNTAATLWCSAAVGIVAGSGQTVLACFITALILMINLGMNPLTQLINRLPRRDVMSDCIYVVTIHCATSVEADVRAALTEPAGKGKLVLNNVTTSRLADPSQTEIGLRYHLPMRDDARIDRIVGSVANRDDVAATGWTMEAMSE
ncbi:MAG TPA: MgtC/SapB family protein [Aliidongia sp.]|nr:MgtC/SapB family protein [Aliidongia sp.]